MKYLLSSAVAVVAASMFAAVAFAQSPFPTRPLTVVVPFPAGSSPDVVMRILSQQLAERLGKPVIIDNRAGAAGNLGAEVVANAAADGHTLLYTVNSVICANPHLYSKMRFDPLTLVPVTSVVDLSYVLLGRPALAATTLPELLALAKSEPGKLTYSSSGNGGGNHIVMEMLMKAAGISMLHVPMRTNPTVAVLTGEVDLTLSPYTTGVPAAQTSDYRAYAVTGARRLATIPNVPTVAEVFPGFLGDGWHGLFAPAGTPQTVVERLNAEMRQILSRPEIVKRLTDLSLEPKPVASAQFAEVVRNDYRKWGQVIREAGIKLD